MLNLAETKDYLKIVDDQKGSPTFTRNVVKNTLKLIEQEQEGTYHITCSGLVSWADFARAIFDFSGKEVEVEPIPSSLFPAEAKRPFFSKLSTNKIQKIDGVEIEDWKKGLKRMLEGGY